MSYKIEKFNEIYNTHTQMPILKEEILNLAIQGKLNKITKLSAQKLVNELLSEKERLLKQKKIKKDKVDDTFKPMYIKFTIPDNWMWMKIGDIFSFYTGLSYDKKDLNEESDSMVRVLRGGNIGELEYFFKDDDVMISSVFVKEDLLLKKNQLILPAVSSLEQTGKLALIDKDYDDVVAGGFLLIATPYVINDVLSKYFFYALSSKFHRQNCRSITNKSGQAFFNLSRPKLLELEIPLPPLEEMQEIVRNVEFLMLNINQLEAKLKLKEHLIAQLPQTVVDAIGNCETEHQLREQLEFVIEYFEEIFQTPDSMQDLRNVILQLAIEGKLVPQDPSDEPASELLKKIKAERDQLVKEKKIKKPAVVEPITEEEIPFEIPESWEWSRLDNLCELITKGSSPNWQGINYVENEEVLFITSENVGANELLLSKKKYVETRFNNLQSRSILRINDILMNIVGASIGRTAIYDLNDIANINQAVCLIRMMKNSMNLEFMLNFFNSNTCIGYMFDKQVDNARANLSMGNIAKFLVPVPPVNEQEKIVKKVESLMSIIDVMEEKLKKKKHIIELLGTT